MIDTAKTGLRRALFSAGLALNVLEVALQATVVSIFFPIAHDDLWAAVLAVGPALLIGLFWRAFIQQRRLRPTVQAIAADAEGSAVGAELAGEAFAAAVKVPRQSLVERTVLMAVLYAVIAPALTAATHLDRWSTLVITAASVTISFGVNAGRTAAYRILLDRHIGRAAWLDRRRWMGATVRERLFVATVVPGALGHVLVVFFLAQVLGVPVNDLAAAVQILPLVHGILGTAYTVYLFRTTRPILAALDRSPSEETLRNGARAAATLPTRLGAATLVWWLGGSTALALRYHLRGALPSEATVALAGLVATGLAMVLFQTIWSRWALLPVRRHCADALTVPPPGLLVSLRLRVLGGLLGVTAFAGTLAYLTAFMAGERAAAHAGAVEAEARREALLPRVREALAAHPTELRRVVDAAFAQGDEIAFVARYDDQGNVEITSTRPLALPARVLDIIDDGGAGTLPVPAIRGSAAWREVASGVAFGVVRSWPDEEASPMGFGALTFVFIVLMGVSLGISALAAGDIAGPVKQLAEAARRFGRGELDRPLPPADALEIADLGQSLDAMRRSLREKIAALDELNRSLEHKVEERTRDLEAAQAQLVAAEKLAALGRLVAGVAHEVNNPLNFIANALPPLKATLGEAREILARYEENPAAALVEARRAGVDADLGEAFELIRIMGNGVERMARIVGSLKDFARADPGTEATPVELRTALDDALDLLKPDLAGRVEVVKRYAPDVPPVLGHPGPLGQVFLNLLKNAAQAVGGEEGRKPRIEVELSRAGGTVRVAITDNGPGIPPEALPKIFEPFFTTKPVGQGTGLGLSICHGIVEKHGGKIEVASEPGKTTFAVTLPARS